MSWLDALLLALRRRQPRVPEGRPPVFPSDLESLINTERMTHGLPTLEPDPRLARLAQSWAEAMQQSGTLSHGDFAARFTDSMVGHAGAENIAYGAMTEQQCVALWMGSPGHRANILGPYKAQGSGRAGDYWCVDFSD